MNINKPNFFIVGAPKCGTTALASYLKEHDNIFMSSPKEPHYFADEFREWFYPCNSIEDYFKLFDAATQSQSAIGEASVLYLYSKDALQKIKDYDPKSKIVVMLRNPIDLSYSWHSQGVFNGDETVKDFQTAWDLQYSRREGKDIPDNCRIPETLQYEEIAKIGSQVEKLLKIFPREQVHFIFLDEFKKNTTKAYKEVLLFLGVDYNGKVTFEKVNANKVRLDNSFSKIKKTKFALLVRKFKKLLGIKQLPLVNKLEKLNTKTINREPINIEFKEKLLSIFLPEINKLEKILGINLSHWKKL
ncbi:sulfotransferase [unidentified eubacterium SCB49]|nr:sulfotransferase [unidentified eubacterium SCB49]